MLCNVVLVSAVQQCESTISIRIYPLPLEPGFHFLCSQGLPVAPIGVIVQSLSHVQFFRDPMDCRLPGSSVHGISQVRILEQVAILFSTGSS